MNPRYKNTSALPICETCKTPHEAFNLRPYGVGGSMICFACAQATPKAKAEMERRFSALLNTGHNVLTDQGLRKATHMDQRIVDVAVQQGRAIIIPDGESNS